MLHPESQKFSQYVISGNPCATVLAAALLYQGAEDSASLSRRDPKASLSRASEFDNSSYGVVIKSCTLRINESPRAWLESDWVGWAVDCI